MAPNMTTAAAIGAVMLASVMWGSWFVCLKHLHGYPLDAFFLTMMAVSIVLVWSLGIILEGPGLFESMLDVMGREPTRVLAPFLGGLVFALGMRLSLRVQSILGLSLSQPVQLSVIILVGTWLSGVIGGLPEGVTIRSLVSACLMLVGAVVCGTLAAIYRSTGEHSMASQRGSVRADRGATWRALLLAIAAGALIPAYAAGLSHGLSTSLRPHGLTVLSCMALVVTGGFLAALASSGWSLSRQGQWHVLGTARPLIHGLGVVSGVCHYGGNVIHALASVHISTVVSWPLGLTSGLWTQLWGLAYGEFKGAPRKAYVALFAAMALYIVGALMIGRALY
jgi:hypothetical protein